MTFKKSTFKIAVAICFAVLIATGAGGLIASAATHSSQTVPSRGQLMFFNVAVYSNSACTQNATSIDWGQLQGGGTSNATVWVKNTGNSNVTLSLLSSNWLPSNAPTWITLSWNQEGQTIVPNQAVQANLVLSVSASIDASIIDFTFNLIISGTT